MRRSELAEFHYIVHMDNIQSIVERGILCHNEAAKSGHVTIASEDVQTRRAAKRVPRALKLHDYANAYFTARNPMLYVLLPQRNQLAVLRISTAILDIQDAVISDGNAASGGTSFYASPRGLSKLDFPAIFAEIWRDPDVFEYWEKKRKKCAEVLVPGKISPEHIEGAYVVSSGAAAVLNSMGLPLQVEVNKHIFFR